MARQPLDIARTDIVENVAARIVTGELTRGDRTLDGGVACRTLLVGQIQVQATGRFLPGQEIVSAARLTTRDVGKIVAIKLRCSACALRWIELATSDAVLGRSTRHELEQPLRTTGVARIGVEAAARLDVGESQEILTRDPAFLRLPLDDVENLLTCVLTGHRWLLC